MAKIKTEYLFTNHVITDNTKVNAKLLEENKILKDCLEELVEIIDGYLKDGLPIDKSYIDSFTTQPARIVLNKLKDNT